jgi:hypothetical protein
VPEVRQFAAVHRGDPHVEPRRAAQAVVAACMALPDREDSMTAMEVMGFAVVLVIIVMLVLMPVADDEDHDEFY